MPIRLREDEPARACGWLMWSSAATMKGYYWRAPCKGGVSQWVRIPPGEFAPAGSNRSSHGGNEVAEASGVEGH